LLKNSFSYITDWSQWPAEDYRAFQVVDLNIKNTQLRIITYHGIWSRDKKGTVLTQKACETIKGIAMTVDHSSLICGDFNLFPDTSSMRIFNDSFAILVDAYDIKTTRPPSNELSD